MSTIKDAFLFSAKSTLRVTIQGIKKSNPNFVGSAFGNNVIFYLENFRSRKDKFEMLTRIIRSFFSCFSNKRTGSLNRNALTYSNYVIYQNTLSFHMILNPIKIIIFMAIQ